MSAANQAAKSDRPQRSSITEEITSFVHSVDALQTSSPAQLAMANAMLMVSERSLHSLFEKSGERVEGSEDAYTIGPEHFLEYNRLSSRVRKATAATRIIPQTFIIALVSQYDSFLGGLLRCLYRAKPELLQASDRQLTYSQLCEFSDIEEAKEQILEKEIETILRMSHTEQFETMQKRFGLPLKTDLPIWPVFVELTERRNLFAHCNGKVSAHYLNVCDQHSVSHGKQRPGVGDTLGVTPAYFIKAHACIFEIGTKLAHVLWRKILPQELAEADGSLLMLGYDLLVAKNYDLATILGHFALKTLKKHSSDGMRRRLAINLAQAYKWAGNADAAAKVVNAEDWSSCDAEFQLAVSVLKGDFRKASELMKLVAAGNILKKNDYRDWPLFNEFRKSPLFIETYQSIYGHQLVPIESHPADSLFNPFTDVVVTGVTTNSNAIGHSPPDQEVYQSPDAPP